MRNRYLFVVLVAFAAVSILDVDGSATYHPTMGRFLNRDQVGYNDGPNLYQYSRCNPTRYNDPYGNVTLEQLNDIASQMGTPQIKDDLSNATMAIIATQKLLGVPQPNGDFGSVSVTAYEKWAQSNGKQPVKLRDSKSSKQVLDWIVQYWPEKHKCAPECPISYGEFLALIHFESRDTSTRTGGQQYTYFNAVGGPFGYLNQRTTAVGLAQFTRATMSREIAYDGEKSIEAALKLMMDDALNEDGSCKFNKEHRSLNRWEAWNNNKKDILEMGKKINDLIKQRKSPANVTEAELNSILGIPSPAPAASPPSAPKISVPRG